jgi:hypothetical protein
MTLTTSATRRGSGNNGTLSHEREVSSRSQPTIRVRKLMDSWCVQKLIRVHDHDVWSLVGSYADWDFAFAVAQVEASPDQWPLRFEERTY